MRIISGKIEAVSPGASLLQDQRLLLRWIFLGRSALSGGILIVAFILWRDRMIAPYPGLASTAAVSLVALFTAGSLVYSERLSAPPPGWFLVVQVMVDILLVTLLVDMTGAGESPFVALYVIVVTVAHLLLQAQAASVVTVIGALLYLGVVWYRSQSMADLIPAALVVLVLAVIALVSRAVAQRLREAGAGRAELAAQLQRVKLEAADILRSIRSGIITVDSSGRLLQANPAAAEILAVRLEEYIEQPVLSRIRDASPELADLLVRTITSRTRINRGEVSMPRGGASIPLGVTTTYTTNATGTPISATAIFQDISESKRAEALGLRAERLAGVAELSASLAHEIRNPLASIRSAVEQLARMQRAEEDERSLAALIERESDRLSRLLGEFLEFSRVHAASFRDADLVGVVRGACTIASAHPDASGIAIRFSAEVESAIAECDEDLVHRAVFNLVLNGAQASAPGASVHVTVRVRESAPFRSAGRPAQEGVEISVSDAGPGIAAADRARIFDPFFTTRSSGTGLGLSVVHRAIAAHHGDVHVESGSGGTTFTILLPVRQSELKENS